MKLIANFSKLTGDNGAVAGGKGASLGELVRAHIPVPPGFVILVDAYERFLQETAIISQIQKILGVVELNDNDSVDLASKNIQALFEATPIPTNISEEISNAFADLGTGFVAVRSSATSEDSLDDSWAGELESYLYVSEANLLESVKKCWSSLFAPRAILYRYEKGMQNDHISVAVVVQKMIASEVSGVCFTVHPVTKNHNQLIIEAGWGLGEAIVGGVITPDSYVFDKNQGIIIDTYISEQTKKIVQKPSGGTELVTVLRDDSERQKLTNKEIIELAKIAQAIEGHYGEPQDIEWAFAENIFWIVQSRPITTLKAKTV